MLACRYHCLTGRFRLGTTEEDAMLNVQGNELILYNHPRKGRITLRLEGRVEGNESLFIGTTKSGKYLVARSRIVKILSEDKRPKEQSKDNLPSHIRPFAVVENYLRDEIIIAELSGDRVWLLNLTAGFYPAPTVMLATGNFPFVREATPKEIALIKELLERRNKVL